MTETAPISPVVTLTEIAASEIKSMLASSPENSGKLLRVFVEHGGCSGMKYGLVFDDARPNDCRAEFHGVGVLVDPFSAQFLIGSQVDFVADLTGGGFKVRNPRAKQACGCGKSFQT